MKNKFNPKVSIIIPVYNGSNYLREAIDSALAQTYKNTEVIVINDGSNDGGKTDKICKSYGNKIRCFKKENGGVSSALNLGIEKMEGEYFSWLSHDDVYYPKKIKRQVEFLSKQKDKENVIPYASYELIDEKSEISEKVWQNHNLLVEKPEYALLRGRINGITLLIPKRAFEEHGKFDEDLRCTQDYDMWVRISKTYRFVHINQILTKTRIHPLQDSNKHPNVVKEGDRLWIKMMEQLPNDHKKRLEGTLYNFYREMYNFLESSSPYEGAKEYAENKMKEIMKKNKNTIRQAERECKVSVIIPFYNNIKELLEAIRSVQKQTHKNYELLLINDGSTVDINEIEGTAKNDGKIELINIEDNRGPGYARNIGIREAKGKYISFLDADDIFVPGKLREQLTQMLLTNSRVSHTSYLQKEGGEEENVRSGKLEGNVIPEIIRKCPIATPTVIIKTSFIRENDYKFREDIRVGEDTCFWLEILRDENLQGIDKRLTVVNKTKKSASKDLKKQLMGLSNILAYIFLDEEYKKYHPWIAYLCQRYVEVSQELTTLEKESNNKAIKKQNKIKRMLELFKYQGVGLTLTKALRKYIPKICRKIKRVLNEIFKHRK